MRLHTFFDFCSGIGGGRLGLEQAGLQCVGRSETSRLADITYCTMHNTDNELNYGNLKKITAERIPKFDLLIAGFPCQTFSVIGRKDGFTDNRGQIIFHIARILSETKPKCFILENVKGLVTHDKGKTISIILDVLNDAGYSVAYKVLSSIDYGVPQMRQRVYFIGVRSVISNSIEDFCWPEVCPKPSLDDYFIDMIPAEKERIEILRHYLNNPVNAGKYTVDDLLKMDGKVLDTRMNDLRIYDGKVPTLRAQRDGILYVKNGVIYRLTGYEALLLQGFPKEYADKVKNKVSDRHLLMQAGNAMTVSIMKQLGESLIEYINNRRIDEMEAWEKYEIECTEYLKNHYGNYANFDHKGKSDSTVPDIEVTTASGQNFYIETKQCPAQCGQFVLLPNIASRRFEYSPLNATEINEFSKAIMEFMNSDFEAFKEAGTSGKDILMKDGSEVFAKWIISAYKHKGVKYFITNNYMMLPVEEFSNYFNVSAKYRIKRSGSGDVGKGDVSLILNHIEKKDYGIFTHRTDNKKLFVSANKNIHNERFVINDTEYMFSKRGEEFEVRKLSNTFNANVIFSIVLKKDVPGMSNTEIINALR